MELSGLLMVAILIAGLGIGVLIGWHLRGGRDSATVATARSAAEAAQQAQGLLERSLQAASEDAARRQSGAIGTQVAGIVEPLRKTLDTLGEHLDRTERDRNNAYSGLSAQLGEMRAASAQLGTHTQRLASALHTPNVRGRWGEMHLRRVVELAGLHEHCDFTTQVSASSDQAGGVRPDLVVHLAGGQCVVVDAKVPLSSYLDALDQDDDKHRDRLLGEHARALRGHVNALSSKKYWTAVDGSPEFVVLFVPADPIVDAALRIDPDLLEYGFARNVVITTPGTLVALLRTVALSWRHDALARDAAMIMALGRDLHHRIATVCTYMDKLGASLNRSVESFNSTVGALESRVSVTARKLSELDSFAGSGGQPPKMPDALDTHARTIDADRLTPVASQARRTK